MEIRKIGINQSLFQINVDLSESMSSINKNSDSFLFEKLGNLFQRHHNTRNWYDVIDYCKTYLTLKTIDSVLDFEYNFFNRLEILLLKLNLQIYTLLHSKFWHLFFTLWTKLSF